MADLERLDRVFHVIMERFIATGQAPHYTELAKGLGVSVEEGRKQLHELMEAPSPVYGGGHYPGWLYPGTDYIALFDFILGTHPITTKGSTRVEGGAKRRSAFDV
jgi:hypothetical protein